MLAEKPDFLPAWIGLGELCLAQDRCAEVEPILARIEPLANGQGTLLRARLHLARREYDQVRRLLTDAIASQPKFYEARRLWSYALLQEDRHLDEAEQALKELIEGWPADGEARHNLEVLRRRTAAPIST